MRIYFDLDDTLIHAKYAASGNPGKRTRVKIIDRKHPKESELYYSLIRPNALEMLDFCRKTAEVRMLTTATRDYALEHNDIFGLAFNPKDIIAREDYLVTIQIGYGTISEPIKTGTDPHAILIDNLHPNAIAAKNKQAFLGIKEDQYIQIREFSGKDPEIFQNEIDDIFKRIDKYVSGKLKIDNNPNNPNNPVILSI